MPCPQCGSAVPSQARFCGQCGRTFGLGAAAAPGTRMIPTTVDEATTDPPPANTPPAQQQQPPPPAPRAHAGVPTAVGHAIPVASPGIGPMAPPNAPPPAPLAAPPPPRAHAGLPTSIGHGVGAHPAAAPAPPPPPAPVPPTFGQTLYDSAPFGAESSRGVPSQENVSQRPTPVVPPPDHPAGMESSPGGEVRKPLAKTMNDPNMAERARAVRDAALADLVAKKDADNEAAASTGPAPPSSREPKKELVFGKTLVLGGIAAADVLPPEVLRSLPQHREPQQPGPVAPPEVSPLSASVYTSPSSSLKTPMQSAAVGTPVQSAPISPEVLGSLGGTQPIPTADNSLRQGTQPIPTATSDNSLGGTQPIPIATPDKPFGGTVQLGAAGAQQTMLGMPAVQLPGSQRGGGVGGAAQPPPPSQRQQATQEMQQPPQGPPPQNEMAAFPAVHQTMLGVAMPGIAPTRDPAPAPTPAPPAATERAGTLLGVAVPGIAPIRPGDPNAQPQQYQEQQQPPHFHHQQQQQQQSPPSSPRSAPGYAPQQQEPPPPIVPAPAPLVMEPLPEAPRTRTRTKKGVPAIAVVAIVFILVVVGGGAAAVFILRSGAPLTAQPQLDESGKESLKIRCESCPDGTVISLGASSSKVQGAATLLPLPAPLSIGDNDLEMKIDRPAAGRDETVKIHVPVAYRVKADLTTLTSSPPAITVRVEAMPGTEVTVDGRPATLDAAGKGAQTIDVTAEVDGPSDDQKAIDKQIPFSIKPKGGAVETGQLIVRAGVIPLHVDAPGHELITDRATANVSGQTKPGGTLTIDGQNVQLDDKGRFGVRVELPADGEKILSITASAPPLAPRTMRAKVVRVASLDAGAKILDARTPAPLTFAAYGAEAASKIGQLVIVDGEVLETRIAQGHTVMLVEEKKACPAGGGSCIVRIVHGEEVSKAARGDTVHAYGRIVGTVTSGGKSVPDIEGSLIIATPRPAGKK